MSQYHGCGIVGLTLVTPPIRLSNVDPAKGVSWVVEGRPWVVEALMMLNGGSAAERVGIAFSKLLSALACVEALRLISHTSVGLRGSTEPVSHLRLLEEVDIGPAAADLRRQWGNLRQGEQAKGPRLRDFTEAVLLLDPRIVGVIDDATVAILAVDAFKYEYPHDVAAYFAILYVAANELGAYGHVLEQAALGMQVIAEQTRNRCLRPVCKLLGARWTCSGCALRYCSLRCAQQACQRAMYRANLTGSPRAP